MKLINCLYKPLLMLCLSFGLQEVRAYYQPYLDVQYDSGSGKLFFYNKDGFPLFYQLPSKGEPFPPFAPPNALAPNSTVSVDSNLYLRADPIIYTLQYDTTMDCSDTNKSHAIVTIEAKYTSLYIEIDNDAPQYTRSPIKRFYFIN